LDKKAILKFDKLIIDLGSDELDTFEEISEVLIGLITIKTDASYDDLISRINESVEFSNTADIQNFLTGYFEFHNFVIHEFEKLEAIKSDEEFNNELGLLANYLLKEIILEDKQEALFDFSMDLVDVILDEYSLEIEEDMEENLKNFTKAFGNSNIAMLFFAVLASSFHLKESENIEDDELSDVLVTLLTFCMAMNSLRIENVIKLQNLKNSANSTSYKAGRNDPCPCGSGRKYKKCCLNFDTPKPLDTIKFDEPKKISKPLSEAQVHDFYVIWSRFLNYASKEYAKYNNEVYKKIYEKNSENKYILTDDAVGEEHHYVEVRNFLAENFFELTENFLEDSRVSQKNIDILIEARDTFKFGDFYLFEMFNNGNTIFYSDKDKKCFYSYRTLYDYKKVFPKNKLFEVMLFSYKGRIISDGVASVYQIETGKNLQEMIKNDYAKNRDKLMFSLDINDFSSRIK